MQIRGSTSVSQQQPLGSWFIRAQTYVRPRKIFGEKDNQQRNLQGLLRAPSVEGSYYFSEVKDSLCKYLSFCRISFLPPLHHHFPSYSLPSTPQDIVWYESRFLKDENTLLLWAGIHKQSVVPLNTLKYQCRTLGLVQCVSCWSLETRAELLNRGITFCMGTSVNRDFTVKLRSVQKSYTQHSKLSTADPKYSTVRLVWVAVSHPGYMSPSDPVAVVTTYSVSL